MLRLLAVLAFFLMPTQAMAACHVAAAILNPTEAGVMFYNLAEHGVPSSTETNENRFVVPTDMVAHSLSVLVDVAPSPGTWTIMVRDDVGDTSLTCAITGGSTTCTDLVNTASIAQGSRVTVGITGSASPATSAEVFMSFCLEEAP